MCDSGEDDNKRLLVIKFIPMEKLIELLNEYNDNKEWVRIWFIKTIDIDWAPTPYELDKSDLLRWEDKIISKKYWFIEWLVDNNKLNFYKWKMLENPIWSNNYDDCDYLELIQWLAISDTPIDDLIYYLK